MATTIPGQPSLAPSAPSQPLRARLSIAKALPKPSKYRAPAWVTRPWTVKRAAALAFWWIMACLVLPIAYVLAGAGLGIVEGLGHGLVKGAAEAHAEARRY